MSAARVAMPLEMVVLVVGTVAAKVARAMTTSMVVPVVVAYNLCNLRNLWFKKIKVLGAIRIIRFQEIV